MVAAGEDNLSARWNEASVKRAETLLNRAPSSSRVSSYSRRQQSTAREPSVVGRSRVIRSASTSRAVSSKQAAANPFLPPADASLTPVTRSSSLRKISLHGLDGPEERELGSCASISVFADYEFVNQSARPSARKSKSKPPDDPLNRSSTTRTTFGSDGEGMLADRLNVRCREPLAHTADDLQLLKTSNDSEVRSYGFTLGGWSPQEREGWLGLISKKGGTISVELPTSWDNVALTSRQWAYGVAVRRGDIHVCAIDLAGAFWYTANFLRANSRRIKHEAKISGIFPDCRVVIEFPHEQFIRWLCVNTHETELPPIGYEDLARRRSVCSVSGAQSKKFSMKSLKQPPCIGFIRQDLSFSISPIRAALAEATGLKGGFISVRKFALGLCRTLYEKHKRDKDSNTNGEAMLALYNELSISISEQSWKARLRVNDYTQDVQSPHKTLYLTTFELICPRVSCAKHFTLNSTPPSIRPLSLCLSRLVTD